MKKFLAILLVSCMLFAVTALANETTFVDPYTIFDFGSDSRLDDMWKPNLLSAYYTNNCVVEENEDSWTVTVSMIADGYYDLSNSNWSKIGSGTPYLGFQGVGNITYGSMRINNGWGGFKPSGYKSATDEWNYSLNAQWIGKNQFMKIRLKNLTDTTLMCVFPDNSKGSYTPMYSLVFDVSANDTEFQTYVVDMVRAEIRTFRKGDYNAYFTPHASTGTEWGAWTQRNLDGMKFWLFGTYGETSKPEDINFKGIELGDTVEIDYAIFAPTAEMANEYKSIDEGYVPAETTTTEKVETTTTTAKVETTTTTAKVETTTTTQKVEETTTTEAIVDETTTTETTLGDHDCTTTTEAVVDETTTEAVVDETTTTVVGGDETTTTVSDGTTTTANGGNNQKDGGFPVWVIIVIVVVIGGGVAAFFVFKK